MAGKIKSIVCVLIAGFLSFAASGQADDEKITPVKVGERFGDLWLITEGLKAGDQVVAEGTQKVRDGVTVAPKTYTPAKPADSSKPAS